jgi:hypothetical protein
MSTEESKEVSKKRGRKEKKHDLAMTAAIAAFLKKKKFLDSDDSAGSASGTSSSGTESSDTEDEKQSSPKKARPENQPPVEEEERKDVNSKEKASTLPTVDNAKKSDEKKTTPSSVDTADKKGNPDAIPSIPVGSTTPAMVAAVTVTGSSASSAGPLAVHQNVHVRYKNGSIPV